MKRWILVLTLILSACSKDPGRPDDGSSSGGGSFGDESSLMILKWASEELSNQILNSSPELYSDLPAGWTRERLAQIIRDVEPTPADRETYAVPEVVRHGQRLMFDYRTRPDGTPYITATRLFVDAHSHFEVNSKPKYEFKAVIDEIKLKLAHEAAHHMGLGLSKQSDMPQARAFANSLMASLDSDNIECMPVQDGIPRELADARAAHNQTSADQFAETAMAWAINRPTGKGIAPSSSQHGCYLIDPVTEADYVEGDPTKCSADGPDSFISPRTYPFAPHSYAEVFDLNTLRRAIRSGARSYAMKDGNYFSWKRIDKRDVVFTELGYRSASDNSLRINPYDREESNYIDFEIKKNTPSELELLSYPGDMQQTWSYARSQGKASLQISIAEDGKILESKLHILQSFNAWIDDPIQSPAIDIEMQLKCVRSFKKIALP